MKPPDRLPQGLVRAGRQVKFQRGGEGRALEDHEETVESERNAFELVRVTGMAETNPSASRSVTNRTTSTVSSAFGREVVPQRTQ